MQSYLVGERLFVGWNIEVFDGDNLIIHGPLSTITHMPIDAMDQHPCVSSGEDNQLVVTLGEQQNIEVATSTIFLPTTILTKTTQSPMQLSIKLSRLLPKDFTQLELDLKFITHLTDLNQFGSSLHLSQLGNLLPFDLDIKCN
jgi:hypothetical protein